MPNGEREHTSGWRWFIGLLVAINSLVLGWVATQLGTMRDKVDVYQDLVMAQNGEIHVLQERMNIWIPIIQGNSTKNLQLEKEITIMQGVDARQDREINRLEKIR